MIAVIKELWTYRELMTTLAWKEIVVRYKQAYLGIGIAVLKPLLLTVIFTMVRSFVGIDTGKIPYPVLTFAALLPWTFFQESAAASVNSVVANAGLIKKIYFPRVIFPLTAVLTKFVELSIYFFLLALFMIWYRMAPSAHAVWVPFLLVYTALVSLTISLVGAALNVYYRDVGQMLPVGINLLMYASPVIYPLSLVHKKLIVQQAAGDWSHLLYTLYTLNPLAGIIDTFQAVMLRGDPPDFQVLWPGFVATLLLLPLSYAIFRRAEAYFADVI
ncbi:lipopolysaccharide transport system permease protein [Desulfacinum hydrothermale DSM 13146]|uniref:Transport permease protein n=1 Tax=Desulfacinum hydrothermale DSM 13146 TaxID=1121390 RepID=A0A1W1XS71_9BACT|nr:ABC transporter permease [Desulfacinum hydrothermale]SMC26391.1 lipopolysaccharide transport system permease protein [Desulfacinum hydrothermale DSM 13146]